MVGVVGLLLQARRSKPHLRSRPLGDILRPSIQRNQHRQSWSDFGTQATLLLAAMILFGMTIVFMCWGAIDLKKAEMYEQRRRRKWVQEWLQSRRLDLTAAAFAVGAIACGYTASSHIASTAAASDAALNILGAQLSDAPFNKSETGSATNILAAAWLCAAAAVVLLLLTLSWDGLSRKLRCTANVELPITG